MKKGFTLIELLAVIVVLALLTLIVGTNVAKFVKSSKNKLSSTQKQLILEAAQIWTEDNLNKLTDNGCQDLYISELIEEGLFEEEQLNKIKNFRDYKVKICTSTTDDSIPNITYEIVEGE